MKILVTGGAGFIGSHVVDAYIARGHRVVVVDNLATGFRKNVNPKARLYRVDIENLEGLRKVMHREQPQVVNHHAARVEVAKSLRDPMPTLAVNTLGTVNVLMAFGEASRARHKKFIFASTGGALYGEAKKIPTPEETSITPLSAYGLSKHLAEEAVRFYARQMDLQYLIFRYANVYGPRQNPKGEGGVVAIFGNLIKHGQRPVIFGDGRKTRDYIYVEDVVRANVLGLTKGNGLELNLGWGREVSDRAVFENIARWYGYADKPVHMPHRLGEVRRSSLNARKAKRAIGWTPKISFEEGALKTLETIR